MEWINTRAIVSTLLQPARTSTFLHGTVTKRATLGTSPALRYACPAMSHSIATLLAEGAASLRAAGIDDPQREARRLLAHATGHNLLDRAARIDPGAYASLLARRAAREPLALITGTQGFWTLDLEVSPATLIPRADTETLIEAALAARPDRAAIHRILDLGTGTGAILLAALAEYPAAWGLGLDRVAAAAALARRNAARNHLAARAAFAAADWAAPIAARFNLVFSNPPYIETATIPTLQPEVARHEPATALDGGPDGLDAYRTLIPTLPRLLAPGGLAILEIGQGQEDAVAALGRAHGFTVTTRPDLAGIARALLLT